MDKVKISLLALFALVVFALVFVFRYKKKENTAMKDKMAEVRASKGLKKYIDPENLEEQTNEEIKNIVG